MFERFSASLVRLVQLGRERWLRGRRDRCSWRRWRCGRDLSGSASLLRDFLLEGGILRGSDAAVAAMLAHSKVGRDAGEPLVVRFHPPPPVPRQAPQRKLVARGDQQAGHALHEAQDSVVALLARSYLDVGPVAFDKVALGVELGEEQALVVHRHHELMDRRFLPESPRTGSGRAPT